MSSNKTQEYELYKTSMKVKTEQLIKMELPVRILELNALLKAKKSILFKSTKLESYNLFTDDDDDASADTAAAAGSGVGASGIDFKSTSAMSSSKRAQRHENEPKRLLPHGWMPCNKSILEMSNMLKPIVHQFLVDMMSIRMWVCYLMPRNQDPNKLHMEIIDDILIAEMEASKFFNQNSQYFLTRSKLNSKQHKYPFIEDCKCTIIEWDDEHSMNLWLLMNLLRNHYATLHDKITKNMDVLKEESHPSHVEHFY